MFHHHRTWANRDNSSSTKSSMRSPLFPKSNPYQYEQFSITRISVREGSSLKAKTFIIQNEDAIFFGMETPISQNTYANLLQRKRLQTRLSFQKKKEKKRTPTLQNGDTYPPKRARPSLKMRTPISRNRDINFLEHERLK